MKKKIKSSDNLLCFARILLQQDADCAVFVGQGEEDGVNNFVEIMWK